MHQNQTTISEWPDSADPLKEPKKIGAPFEAGRFYSAKSPACRRFGFELHNTVVCLMPTKFGGIFLCKGKPVAVDTKGHFVLEDCSFSDGGGFVDDLREFYLHDVEPTHDNYLRALDMLSEFFAGRGVK